ncbi:valine--tRNA ligase, partial [Candidatus Saccharibacteria bacterium 32-45-3]
WNISRFVENKLGDNFAPQQPKPETLADHWIVNELSLAKKSIEHALNEYRYSEAAEAVYHVIWDSVADWYIEASKDEENKDMLAWVLNTSLKLAHPFAPFVTETIWQTLPWNDGLLIQENWPTIIEFSEIAAAEFGQLQSIVSEARFVSTSLPGNDRYALLYQNDSLIQDNQRLIRQLAKLSSVMATESPKGLRLALANHDAWLDVSEDTLEEHRQNLEIRLAGTRQEVITLEARLANENYINKAPEKLVEETKTALKEKQALVERLLHELDLVNK